MEFLARLAFIKDIECRLWRYVKSFGESHDNTSYTLPQDYVFYCLIVIHYQLEF